MKIGKRKYRGTLCCDIDGVLADFESKFCEDFGYENRHLYSRSARYPDVDPELIDEWVKNPENYKDLRPIFGGLLLIRQAHQRGWYVLLATARDSSLMDVTRNWLSKYGAVYNEIIFSKAKKFVFDDFDNLNPDKPIKIVVDDNPSVLESMPNRFGVAWSQPWNEEYLPKMWYSDMKMKILVWNTDGTVRWIWDNVRSE